MIIANRSIHIIDYENNRILSRDIPATFDEYVGELIEHINRNDSVRDYKTRSRYTEVISGAIAISSQKDMSMLGLLHILRKFLFLHQLTRAIWMICFWGHKLTI